MQKAEYFSIPRAGLKISPRALHCGMSPIERALHDKIQLTLGEGPMAIELHPRQ